ncbi:hypothetical protein [Streptomyces sp. NBC_01568]|uniref:hypothetical protein n=1 Tax=Streptomyces sp. NBC_01568 TaxID=2975882 RepID=UPI0038658A36
MEFTLQIIDLVEQTRRLGQAAPTLMSLITEVETVRAGEIEKPVRELAPIAVRLHGLAMQYTAQLATLSTSQYAAMKDGHQNLAELAKACAHVSFAATMCTFAIHRRTEVLLYEDGDETPKASRDNLKSAAEELMHAAKTYRRQAQRLSFRLASTPARHEDQQLIAQALAVTPANPEPRSSTAGPDRDTPGNPSTLADPSPAVAQQAAPARTAGPPKLNPAQHRALHLIDTSTVMYAQWPRKRPTVDTGSPERISTRTVDALQARRLIGRDVRTGLHEGQRLLLTTAGREALLRLGPAPEPGVPAPARRTGPALTR